ncbi:NUDIX domain-containing protein [Nitrosococcus wardiae]|uniref:NUDIX hydrolase n=1 Tax=Nitrosococcus wardiae TaxID=1814290 RepID=A0A4P7BXY7_9GAMM|nr:NUDIX hydrolase [Nitrosococcus wardiae]QBQ53312.1 NUDIX hydrolase [Nitrosococcus wardiae]
MPKPMTPLLTVDIIITLKDQPNQPIVLIKRRNPPLGWALPGGFVDVGEMLEQAATREAREETGLSVKLETLLGCYSDPTRDPRGHTVSAVYIANASGTPKAADDAAEAALFSLDKLPRNLAFDHRQILTDYARYRSIGELAPIHHPGSS